MLANLGEATLLVGVVYVISTAPLDQRLMTLLLVGVVFLLTSMTRTQRARAGKSVLLSNGATASGVRKMLTQEVIEHLPSWVLFPDTEKADWLNTWLHKLWPYINVATEDTMKAKLNPIFERLVSGTPIRRLHFTKFSLGGTPLSVEGVRCHHRGSHAEIVLDLDIRLAGKPDIELEVGASSFACVPVTLSELQMAGTLRIVFSPLCTTWPCFANLSVGFVRQPLVDCRLAVATNAFDVMSMPGIADALHRVLSVSIASSFTWPNFVTVPLVDGHEIDAEDFALNFGMAGILELEIVRATGLRRGGHAGGGSGGARSMQTTALSMLAGLSPLQPYLTVEKSGANPTRYPTVKRVSHGACAFNVLCEYVVDHPTSDSVVVRVYDDQIADEFLGSVTVDVAQVARTPNGAIDKWLTLAEGPAHGALLRVRAQWRPFPSHAPAGQESSQSAGALPPEPAARSLSLASAEEEDALLMDPRVSCRSLRAAREPGPTVGLLSVQLHSASDLLAMDFGGTSDPYAVLSLHSETHRSKVVHKTCAPRWEEKFRFFVRDVDSDALRVAFYDFDAIGSHDPLGEVVIPVAELVRRPRTHNAYTISPPAAAAKRAIAVRAKVTLTVHWVQLVNGAELLPPDASDDAALSMVPKPAPAAGGAAADKPKAQ